MSPTNDIWTDRLSEYIDDELTPEERREIEAHLGGCGVCSATLQDLRRIVDQAKTAVPPAPPHDLWSGVAARIGARKAPRRISFTLPQLAAASVLLVLMSGAIAWRLHSTITRTIAAGDSASNVNAGADPIDSAQGRLAPAPSAQETPRPRVEPVGLIDKQYDSAVADLQRAVDAGRGRLDPATIAVVRQNLEIIDRAIDQARQALVDDPNNSYLTQHLVETRRRKLDLLRRAAALATDSD
jgi:hypothetical protein